MQLCREPASLPGYGQARVTLSQQHFRPGAPYDAFSRLADIDKARQQAEPGEYLFESSVGGHAASTRLIVLQEPSDVNLIASGRHSSNNNAEVSVVIVRSVFSRTSAGVWRSYEDVAAPPEPAAVTRTG